MGCTNGELSKLPRPLAKPHMLLEQKYQWPEHQRQFTELIALPLCVGLLLGGIIVSLGIHGVCMLPLETSRE